ncbi:MAG: class I SAM-dependent methyltransferase [Caldilineaceae bacterium]
MRKQWNQVSAHYQARRQIQTKDVHYGPWAPTERALGLLGDVRGQHVLELGCGGGQCCIALAKQGAYAVGIDVSDEQIAFARTLAAKELVDVHFRRGSATNLSAFQADAWDIVLSIYTFPYLDEVPACLAECYRVLRPGGQLIFSLDHPFRACFFDAEDEELALYPVRSYFDNTAMQWTFADTGVTLETQHYTVAQWFTLLQQSGFQVQRVLEPLPPLALLDELWPEDSPYAPLRHLPQTIIFVAEKAR